MRPSTDTESAAATAGPAAASGWDSSALAGTDASWPALLSLISVGVLSGLCLCAGATLVGARFCFRRRLQSRRGSMPGRWAGKRGKHLRAHRVEWTDDGDWRVQGERPRRAHPHSARGGATLLPAHSDSDEAAGDGAAWGYAHGPGVGVDGGAVFYEHESEVLDVL